MQSLMLCSVSLRREGVHLDTTDTLTSLDGNLDIALFTPSGAPGVLDEPIVETRGRVVTVADGKDGVIKLGAAQGRVQDSRSVCSKDLLVSLDRDRKRLCHEGALHLKNVVLGDVKVN